MCQLHLTWPSFSEQPSSRPRKIFDTIFPWKFSTFLEKAKFFKFLIIAEGRFMNKVWAQVVIFVFSISLAFHESWSTYAGSASSTINPSKVKQVSSKPRYLIRTIHHFFFFSFFFALYFEIYFCILVLDAIWFIVCRAYVYEGFLTELECDHLISLVSSIQ